MLLKNFASLLATAGGDTLTSSAVKTTAGKELTASKGFTLKNILTDGYNNPLESRYNGAFAGSTVSEAVFCIILGDGDTPPTVDDYKLSGNYISYTNLNSTIYVMSNGSNGFSFTIQAQVKSQTTIKEIALAASLSSTASGEMVMLTRDVLPEPVVLEAGGSKVFEIFIDTQSFVTNASQA